MSDIIAREFERLDALEAKKIAVGKEPAYKAARKKRIELLAKIQPLEAELREVNEAIKAGKAAIYPIDQEIAMVSKALSGKRDPRKAPAE
jgi:hypothetical protein